MIHIVYERAIQASPWAAEELVAVPPAPRRAGAQVHAAHVEPWPPGASEPQKKWEAFCEFYMNSI